jgi:CRISPR-associated protein Cas1
MLPPIKPLPMKDRVSLVFIQYGQVDVLDGAFVVVDQTGTRTHIPVGSVACIMLEPGTRVSHAAVHLASTAGTLLVWVGEAGVRRIAGESATSVPVSQIARARLACPMSLSQPPGATESGRAG